MRGTASVEGLSPLFAKMKIRVGTRMFHVGCEINRHSRRLATILPCPRPRLASQRPLRLVRHAMSQQGRARRVCGLGCVAFARRWVLPCRTPGARGYAFEEVEPAEPGHPGSRACQAWPGEREDVDALAVS